MSLELDQKRAPTRKRDTTGSLLEFPSEPAERRALAEAFSAIDRLAGAGADLERARESWNEIGAALVNLRRLLNHFREDREEEQAAAYWGSLADYHLSNDQPEHAIARSEWLARDLLPQLGVSSLLEVGTNSGRNLEYIHRAQPQLRLCGIDVNAKAIHYARAKGLPIDFRVADANAWDFGENSWDAILTMSVLDHIPDGAVESLVRNIARSASRYVICVELWDGAWGTRDLYKYSRDYRALFGAHGIETQLFEASPGQYDVVNSRLYAFVGRVLRTT